MEQLYFENEDSNWCQSLEYFDDDTLEELNRELILAIPAPEDYEYVWCMAEGEAVEKQLCKKSECSLYSSKSGRGVCEHRGSIYLHGEKVKVN